jgi:hypothetical protein
MATLSEIDRHLFLQFLEAEIRFLLGHRVQPPMTADTRSAG